jgi:hypothetical protein
MRTVSVARMSGRVVAGAIVAAWAPGAARGDPIRTTEVLTWLPAARIVSTANPCYLFLTTEAEDLTGASLAPDAGHRAAGASYAPSRTSEPFQRPAGPRMPDRVAPPTAGGAMPDEGRRWSRALAFEGSAMDVADSRAAPVPAAPESAEQWTCSDPMPRFANSGGGRGRPGGRPADGTDGAASGNRPFLNSSGASPLGDFDRAAPARPARSAADLTAAAAPLPSSAWAGLVVLAAFAAARRLLGTRKATK